jgi:hypothetical protein
VDVHCRTLEGLSFDRTAIAGREELSSQRELRCGRLLLRLLHMQDADRAIAEARRVVRPGDRFTFTVWMSPLPPAPPIFRFADMKEGKFDLIHKSAVRVPIPILAPTEDARARIHQAIRDGAEAFRRGRHLEVPGRAGDGRGAWLDGRWR